MASEYLHIVTAKLAELAQQHPYISLAGSSLVVATLAFSFLQRFNRRSPSTKLSGPPSTSWLIGHFLELRDVPDSAVVYSKWAETYGSVYKAPMSLGTHAYVVCDPKAVTTVLAKDTSVYYQSPGLTAFFEYNFGKNLLVTEGGDHKRQRRALSSGFSIAAIRSLTSVFYESVYGVKNQWDIAIQSGGKGIAEIEVQQWMNNISLDSIGKGGFSHDFGATRGEHSSIAAMFAALGDVKPTVVQLVVFLFGGYYGPLFLLPTDRRKVLKSLSNSFHEIAMDLFEKAKKEKEAGNVDGIDKSIVGALVKAETGSSNVRMNLEEIESQINMFMIAGYETTAITLTWALIELSRNPDIQKKLRDEVTQFGDQDPTYEQLSSGLPYLDAVIHETLRLHPSLPDVIRIATEDNVLPLSEPMTDATGKAIEEVVVPKGIEVIIPINAVNRLDALWGANGSKFDPERWIDDSKISSEKAARIQGYRHLLTFADGPRTCLGRLFALTEIKAVLSVLIRDFAFELPQGSDTKFVAHRGFLPRPKVAGEEGARVPLLVRRAN